MKITTTTNQSGYVLLLSVMCLSAIGTAIAASVLLWGLASGQTTAVLGHLAQARGLADACAETALADLRQDAGYAGGEIINLGAGSCNILPIVFADGIYKVDVTGTVLDVARKLSIQATRQTDPNLKMDIVSWQEVPDF